MGLKDLFKSKTTEEIAQEFTPPVGSPVGGVNLAKGSVSLTKGSSINMLKKADTVFTASVSWKSGTDYDVYALVLKRDGKVETASFFGIHGRPVDEYTPVVANGAVKHLGDVGRSAGSSRGGATETVEIRMTDDIVAVVPVAYSAQSNGSGSFYKYKVSLAVDNGAGDKVTIDANNASKDNGIYTCVPAIIWNRPGGAEIQAVELYSRRGSELRPAIDRNGNLTMDAGPRNIYK